MVTALAAFALLGGCTKTGGSKGSPGGAGASALDIMPADTAFLGGMNVGKLTSSKLWKEYGSKLVEQGEGKEALTKLKDKCGFDPMTGIQTVAFGANAAAKPESVVVVISGKFDKAITEKCVTALAAEDKKKVTITTEGKITTIKAEGEDDELYLGWLDDHTIVVVPDAMSKKDKSILAKVLESKGGAKANKGVSDLMTKVSTGNTVWGIADLAAAGEVGQGMSEALGAKPAGAWLNFEYQTDLKAEVGLRFATADEAKKVADDLNGKIKQFAPQAGMVGLTDATKNVKAEAKGSDCIITVQLTGEEIDKIVKTVGPMISQFLPGGGGGGGGDDLDAPPPGSP
jgi:hypothetical protein